MRQESITLCVHVVCCTPIRQLCKYLALQQIPLMLVNTCFILKFMDPWCPKTLIIYLHQLLSKHTWMYKWVDLYCVCIHIFLYSFLCCVSCGVMLYQWGTVNEAFFVLEIQWNVRCYENENFVYLGLWLLLSVRTDKLKSGVITSEYHGKFYGYYVTFHHTLFGNTWLAVWSVCINIIVSKVFSWPENDRRE